ncbi:hypothetical protein CDV31_012584 [Fusarium ambrosium]|uniref:Heterokaryon incompatibility domain-containing protein n=1 Tax=Fusarium ambrosium TaxID=131363 RepID=A0A428T915_9HYPO|nr:hypothetical protein CDV31_012584 [Fusarium ambrosium]
MPEAVREFSSVAYDPSDTTTGSPKSSRLAARWLQICVAEHPTCTSYCGSDPPPLPTRVIDIGAKGSTEGRLFISRGRYALYVALSHCWGSSPIFTLTSKNITELQTKVRFSDLPLTFQHAIEITRDLGVRYIWIDSLCIIQDSAEDWDIESSRMRNVYRNSICTIAAAKAKDGSGGCFSARDPCVSRPVQLSLQWPYGESQGDYSPKETFWSKHDWTQPTGPLYTRAWVFQEQSLSGRMLSFCEGILYWNCSSLQASDYQPAGEEHSAANAFGRFRALVAHHEEQRVAKGLGASAGASSASKLRLYDAWSHMATEYSKRALTFETDRLPALSALAEQMADLLDDEYLAGLWKGDIVRGLLWCCTGKSGTRSKAPEKYVAPSWSWASVRGAVIAADFARGFRRGLVVNDYVFPDQFRSVGPLGDMTQNRWDELVDMYNPSLPLEPEAHYDESDDFSLISANCVRDGHNSFGRVKNGQLRVTGWIKLAKTASRREEDGQDGHPEGGMDLLDPESGAVFGGLNYDEDQGRPYGCTIWCLFLMWRVGREGEGGTGLALLPTGLEEDEFRRIGLAGINERDWTRGRKKMTITIV